jgi:hypothetical protein
VSSSATASSNSSMSVSSSSSETVSSRFNVLSNTYLQISIGTLASRHSRAYRTVASNGRIELCKRSSQRKYDRY